MNQTETVNVNDKLDEAKNGLGQFIVDHPELIVASVGILCYVSYQHGRNRAFMDTMRMAALSDRK